MHLFPFRSVLVARSHSFSNRNDFEFMDLIHSLSLDSSIVRCSMLVNELRETVGDSHGGLIAVDDHLVLGVIENAEDWVVVRLIGSWIL